MPEIASSDVEEIVEEFELATKATAPISVGGLEEGSRTFRVSKKDLPEEVFIVDTDAGREIACHPHIVGSRLEDLCLTAARDSVKAMRELSGLRRGAVDTAAVVHILRAGPGYRLLEAIHEQEPKLTLAEIVIRPRYVKPSFRDHESVRRLEVLHSDFRQIPRDSEIAMVVPDTLATGRTVVVSLEKTLDEVDRVGSSVRRLIVYGFISAQGIKVVADFAASLGIPASFFCIGNVTGLAYNGYDMPLYGLDESEWSKRRQLRKLGAIVDESTLWKYLPEYVPGLDQPGDWSSRQTQLFTGVSWEPGGITEHLRHNLHVIQTLRTLSKGQPWFKPWHEDIFRKELQAIERTLTDLSAQGDR